MSQTSPTPPSSNLTLRHALNIQAGDVVAFVGGGGKSSAMFRLAAELSGGSPALRVLMTTSTRIFEAQIKRAPAHVSLDLSDLSDLSASSDSGGHIVERVLPALTEALDRHGQVLLVGHTKTGGKAFGIEPALIDALAQTGRFDVILVEADGSRMRPFKAPAEHEPVIPTSATVVAPVVGIDALGQPLNSHTTHRPERVSHLSGTPLEQPITTQTIASVLGHPDGGLKNAPAGARVMPLINKIDTPARLPPARKIARVLLAYPRIEAVALGVMQATAPPIYELHRRIAAVVLAAGGSSRFGSPKQLARWQGKTFLEQAVNTALASQADPVVVVLGAEAEACRLLLKDRPVTIVVNDNWAEGQSGSMQAGLARLPRIIGGALFLLVDLPRVTPETLNSLIEAHQRTLAPVVWPEYQGQRGNPVLFDRRLFGELAQISGDTGGKPLLKAYQAQAVRVPAADDSILQDFDHPEDLAEARSSQEI